MEGRTNLPQKRVLRGSFGRSFKRKGEGKIVKQRGGGGKSPTTAPRKKFPKKGDSPAFLSPEKGEEGGRDKLDGKGGEASYLSDKKRKETHKEKKRACLL